MPEPQNIPQDFSAIRLRIVSPEEVLSWSHGEVTKPETINYRTQRSEKDGLFDERIFGPERDYECYCGKYRKIRYKGVVCDKCGVEITRSVVRRERMGHIKLAAPVSHIWFLRGTPSRVGLFLGLPMKALERVIYFTSYIVTHVDDEARQAVLADIQQEFATKKRALKKQAKALTKKVFSERLRRLDERHDKSRQELKGLHELQVLSEVEFYELSLRYGEVFEAGIGAGAVREILEKTDLEQLRADLRRQLKEASAVQKRKLHQRLRLVESFIRNNLRPEWMFLTILPVIPPDLRPMVQLDGGRFATSDVNDLYRRVINRNNRLKRLIEINAPEVIVRNEKRMLQEAVDAFIDNSARKGREVRASSGQKRILKSLADMLKGKQGRFRQNLLGKRVDYSGRSVIVVGSELKLEECGLPKRMALEVFKPFVVHKLIYEKMAAPNIKAASRLIESEEAVVWDALEEVIENKLVLLNRAPTLHRLSIQAFRPVLIEGRAIELHPLVCSAFNADFDGDQMAVHLPLSAEAQKEARDIITPKHNLLKPATAKPIVNPTQDIVLGAYWMTKIESDRLGEGRRFANFQEAILAWQAGVVDFKAKVTVQINGQLCETSVGRILFNQVLPAEIPFQNELMSKKRLQDLTLTIIEQLGMERSVKILDAIKRVGFHYATLSGISWGMDDLIIPAAKKEIMEKTERSVEEVRKHFEQGLLTEEERRIKTIELWLEAVDKIGTLVPQALPADGSIYAIFDSGARGSWGQTTQMSGIKGLVINPASEIIELPVKASFKEGFNVLEYFISTHGARKGTTDTALKTAVAGYLTRRLVDVCQDIIVREADCQTKEGICAYRKDSEELGQSFADRLRGRVTVRAVPGKGRKKNHIGAGELIDKLVARQIDEDPNVTQVELRSPITCETRFGICQKCYGYDLGRNQLVNIGEAVGIVTAQSIGEPGTQLTMRTFHVGGVAGGGGDITQGLPRVEELFEVRLPKERAVISEIDGQVAAIRAEGRKREVVIEGRDKKTDKKKQFIYGVPLGRAIWVEEGDLVSKGMQLSEGSVDLQKLYQMAGRAAVERYIMRQVQNVYSSQGAGIDYKYIEMVIKKMFSRYQVVEAGDTELLPGEIVEADVVKDANDQIKKKGGRPAKVKRLLLGITKVALTSNSFLSAASFQETARTLIQASVEGKIDYLRGLKENVIIGKLIPAGTGYRGKK